MKVPIGIVELKAVLEATFRHFKSDIFNSLEFALDLWVVFREI
jgi:hypothetical protein